MEAMEARDVFGEENSSSRDGKQLEGGKIGVLLWCEFLWSVMSAEQQALTVSVHANFLRLKIVWTHAT